MLIETERLLLRPYEEGDYADYRAYFDDPELWRMLGYRPFRGEEDFRGDFGWRLGNPRVSALALKETGRVVGHLCVGELDPATLAREELRGKRCRSLSFSLHRELRRQGLMSEALRAALAELFRSGEAELVVSGYFSFNAASAALHRKLGFRELFRHTEERRGETVEVIETVLRPKDLT
ncbi:MAG: GNAT family N-acetyltransferase [Oscillospiraceae bacterium]|nr:GNAT family N-acetyltransferase [Oscillospiraceae bacterium]